MESNESAGVELKPMRVRLSSWDTYQRNKAYLVSIGADFRIESCGNVERLLYGGKEFMYIDTQAVGGNGHHLTRIFKSDIDKWLAVNAESMPRWDKNYCEQMFNINAIERNIGVPLVLVDINDCYWRTAFLLGYITEQTYIKGLRQRDWKIGRNACIGGLAKTSVVSVYRAGKVSVRNVIRPKEEYQYVRNHIIGHVHKIFSRLFGQMGNAFFMMLTDCLVTTYGNLKYVQSELKAEGYKSKHKPVEFTLLDRANKTVHWVDFSDKEKNEKGIAVPRDKYYIYAHHQVVQSEVVDTTGFYKPRIELG